MCNNINMDDNVWRGRGRWVLGTITILLIIATVIIGKDFSYGCENSETPTCKNGEYKRRMFSNKTFIWFLLLSVGFLIMTILYIYFSSGINDSAVVADVATPEVTQVD